MIFDRIDFHNVAELEEEQEGYVMWRIPKEVRDELNDCARNETSAYATGVELRFKIKGDSAVLTLSAAEGAEASVAYIYYGSIQGGLRNSSRVIQSSATRIRIDRPDNMDYLKKLSAERRLPFSPEVVRVILPYQSVRYIGIEGDVEPPTAEELPGVTYLAYGSSITHGSLALAAPCTYPFRLAQKLGCDYLNLGFAGSAHMEKVMAEYLVSRKDWDFATLELGINMLGFEASVLERRADEFTAVLASDGRPVYATNLYGFSSAVDQEKGDEIRRIVEKYARDRLWFQDGRAILDDPVGISQDMFHPSVYGMEQIADRWYQILKDLLIKVK